jgi:PTH2 family peptidyl-tRNA hydrolase
MSQEYKQAIVVRNDLKMRKGKIAAQVAHASLIGAEEARKRKPEVFKRWWEGGQKKVVLKVNSLEEILQLARVAECNRVVNAVVEDKGLTQVPPGTITCISVGPDEEEKIQKITGKLKLL